MPRHKPDELSVKQLKDFYNSYLLDGNYKVERWHQLARQKGIPANMVSQCLEKKKAPCVFNFLNLRSRDNQFKAADVKDETNCQFLLKFMATVGLIVPKTAVPEKALVEVATLHNLLGDGAAVFEIEAWANTEADLHRGLMQYACRRSLRNPTSRSWDKNMAKIKAMVKALEQEGGRPSLVRKRTRTPSKKSPGKKSPAASSKKAKLMTLDSADHSSSDVEELEELGERGGEEESATDDECVSVSDAGPAGDVQKPKEKPFSLRSVPDTLRAAADDELADLRASGLFEEEDLLKAQMKLRSAADSFKPAAGETPSDAPKPSAGRGKGRGRGRGGRGKGKKAKGSDEEECQEDAGTDADLEQEDQELEVELEAEEGPGEDEKPKKTPKKPTRRRRGSPRTPKTKKPKTPKRRRTPKLKRALRAATADNALPEIKEHQEVVQKFRDEANKEIQDSRFIIPFELSNVKSFTLPSLSPKGPSIRVLFVTRSFFIGPIDQQHVDSVNSSMGGPDVKVNPSRKSVTLSWAKHGGLKSAWSKACVMAGWDPLG